MTAWPNRESAAPGNIFFILKDSIADWWCDIESIHKSLITVITGELSLASQLSLVCDAAVLSNLEILFTGPGHSWFSTHRYCTVGESLFMWKYVQGIAPSTILVGVFFRQDGVGIC